MNRVELENENLPALVKTAGWLARALYDGARAGRSKKELLAIVTEKTGSLRVRCAVCAAEWPVMLLGHEDARHICVVARRTSFVSLRRRLEEHCRRVRLKCPSCMVNAENLVAEKDADVAGPGCEGTGQVSIEAGTYDTIACGPTAD